MVTCGGEPMLDLEEYYLLTNACRSLGLGCFSVVNGTRVHNERSAERMVTEGPSEVTISLDHWIPEENDRLRGAQGAHLVASRAVKLLAAARSRLHSTVKINVMTILSEDTWRTLSDFFEYVLGDLGADKLKLNVIQPTFQNQGSQDTYYATSSIKDIDGCMSMIKECDRKWSIARNPQWIADVRMYLQSIRNPLMGWHSSRVTSQAICNSYERNIMLDLYGNARLCFSEIFPSTKVEPETLKDFWYSTPFRECMIGCKQYCGISHSVRRSESTLKDKLVSGLSTN